VESTMSNKKLLKIIPLGDVHYGSPSFNMELFEKWIEVTKHSRNKVILLNGDLIEFLDSNRFHKPSDYVNVNDQLEFIIDNLKPFRKDIRCNLNGNHGVRTKKQYDLDTDKLIGDALGVETAKSFHQDLCIKQGKHPEYLRVFMQHEAPTSKSSLLAMRRFIDQMENIDAGLYIGGHNHRTMFITKIYRGLDYTPIRKSFCFSGSFLNYKGSYADNGRFDFQIPSFPVITIDKDGNINSKTYWADSL
jgi:predicted MPP superfamily phosphohydrolase